MELPLCKCGCGQVVSKNQRGKPNLYIHGHNRQNGYLRQEDPFAIVRWLLKRSWISPEGCWEWGEDSVEYPRLRLQGKHQYLHRWAFQLFRGEISREEEIDHLCENCRCWNPEHGEVVSGQENMRRRWANDGKQRQSQIVRIARQKSNEPAVRIGAGS